MINDRESFLKGFIAGTEIVYSPNANSEYMSHGFRATFGGSQGFYQYATAFGGADPVKAQKLLQSIGVYDKILICEVGSKGYCGGYYFDAKGRFWGCAAKARFNWSDDREFGIRSLKDVSIVANSEHKMKVNGIVGGYYYPIYYSQHYAQLYAYNLERVVAFNWDKPWAYDTAGAFSYKNVTLVRRSSVGGGFGNTTMGSFNSISSGGLGTYSLTGAKTGSVVFLA